MTRRLLFPLACALALAGAAPADAATVSLTTSLETITDPTGTFKRATHRLALEAAPGEANAVSLRVEGDAFVVGDAGAPLVPGEGCAAAGPAVACPLTAAQERSYHADLRLGDGDDLAEVRVAPLPASVVADGGDGADRLAVDAGIARGGAGDDALEALARATLEGGDGVDRLTGSAEDDLLDGGAGSDVLDGADGIDVVAYTGRTEPVEIDLAATTAGSGGLEDAVARIEGGRGGEGDDALRAGSGPARLDGAGGDDLVIGGPGADDLHGGTGGDRVVGGLGDDRIAGEQGDDDVLGDEDPGHGGAAAGGADEIDAGPGSDRVSAGPGDDVVREFARGVNTLRGEDGDDTVAGGQSDLVVGGAGDDHLSGGGLVGGRGDDALSGGAASLTCGGGRDRVIEPVWRRAVPRDCEQLRLIYGRLVVPLPVRMRGGVVRLPMVRPERMLLFGGRGRLWGDLLLRGEVIATASTTLHRDAPVRRLRWSVTRAARWQLAQGAIVRIRLWQSARRAPGAPHRAGFSTRVN